MSFTFSVHAQSFVQKMDPVDFSGVVLQDNFWSSRLEANVDITIKT